MHRIILSLHLLALTYLHRVQAARRATGERGQATAEYALVLLGAAALALLVLAWATSTGKITTLLNRVVDTIISQVA